MFATFVFLLLIIFKLDQISSFVSVNKANRNLKDSSDYPVTRLYSNIKTIQQSHSESLQEQTTEINDEIITNKSIETKTNPNLISMTIEGDPIALVRHRIARGIMYNPSSKDQKKFLLKCIDSGELPSIPWSCPIQANLVFYFKRPLSHFGTGKNSKTLKHNMETWHCKRKDLDNMIKFVLDSLNGKAYNDDSQVCVIHSAKLYTENEPKTIVNLVKLDDSYHENYHLDMIRDIESSIVYNKI